MGPQPTAPRGPHSLSCRYVLGLAVDPFEIGTLTVIRLLTVLRLQSFIKDLVSFEDFLRVSGISSAFGISYARQWQLEFARVLISIVTLLSVASGLFYELEYRVYETLAATGTRSAAHHAPYVAIAHTHTNTVHAGHILAHSGTLSPRKHRDLGHAFAPACLSLAVGMHTWHQ